METAQIPDFRIPGSRISGILLSNDSESGELRSLARRFIEETIDGARERTTTSIRDLRAFPVTIWFLKALDINVLTTRVINRTRDILEAELRSSRVTSEDIESYAEAMGIQCNISLEDERYLIPVTQFITFSSRISGPRYRLVNQAVKHGKVICSRELTSKIIREAFVRKAFEAYSAISREDAISNTTPAKEVLDDLRKMIEERGITQDVKLGSVDYDIFPPCIKEYISQMKDGVNLPHMARFTLVSFLHKIGMNSEEIIALFRTAPDFKEKLTTYQVNHVTGQTSSTEYSPPKCTVLQSNHLCYKGEDTVCNSKWLKHPLQYYTFKKMKPLRKAPFNNLEKR